MSNYDELLVGALALIIAAIAAAIALGPWEAPYRLRTMATLSDRFGRPAARSLWFAIALAAFSAGLAIISGTRPTYAKPSQEISLE